MSDENFSPEFGTPYQAIIDHLEAGDIRFRADAEQKSVFFSIRCDAATYDVALLVTHDDEVFQVYVVLPLGSGNEKMRPLMAEFVARANHRLVLGAFDLDMDDGRVRYHVGHVIGEGGLANETIHRLIGTAVSTADRYFPALAQVLFAGHTPADAVYLAELDLHAEAVEDAAPAPKPSAPSPKAMKLPAKKKPRRPRKDPRLKSTQELPGLFDKGSGKKAGGKATDKANPNSPDGA